MAVARAVAPAMTEGGSLSTLTYLGSTRVVPNYNVMGVAKASLEAAVRYLASEMGANKIRVNAISAGPIKTVSARAVKDFSTVLEAIQTRAPLKRNTDPAEVADAAVFLASDLGRGVTGNCLFVDAGMQVLGFSGAFPRPRRARFHARARGSGFRSLSAALRAIKVRDLNMKVEVVLTEADIAQEFAEAIEARDLPEKFFFWFTRSAAEWAALTEHAELYGGLWETWKQISTLRRRWPLTSAGACR